VVLTSAAYVEKAEIASLQSRVGASPLIAKADSPEVGDDRGLGGSESPTVPPPTKDT